MSLKITDFLLGGDMEVADTTAFGRRPQRRGGSGGTA